MEVYSEDDITFSNLPVEILLYVYSYLPGRSVLLSMTASKQLLSVAASYLLTDGLDNQSTFQALEFTSKDLATLLRYTTHPLASLSLYNVDSKIVKPAMHDIAKCIARNSHCFETLHINCKDIPIKSLRNTFSQVFPRLRTLSLKNVTLQNNNENDELYDIIGACENLESLKLENLSNQRLLSNHTKFRKVLTNIRNLHLIGVGADLIRGNHKHLTQAGIGAFSIQGMGAKDFAKETPAPPTNDTDEPQKIIFDYCPNLRSLRYNHGQQANMQTYNNLQIIFDDHFKHTMLRIASQLEQLELGVKSITFLTPDGKVIEQTEEEATLEELSNIPTMFPYLQTLSWEPVITGLSKSQAWLIPTLFRGIHTLEISSTTMSENLQAILTNCTRLQRLKFSNGVVNDAQVVEPLTQVLIPNLQVLEFDAVSTITMKTIVAFTQSCTNLRELYVRNCDGLPTQDQNALRLIEKSPIPLRILDMSDSAVPIPLLFYLLNLCDTTLEKLILVQIKVRRMEYEQGTLFKKSELSALNAIQLSFSDAHVSENKLILAELVHAKLPRLKVLSLARDKSSYSVDNSVSIETLNAILSNCSQLATMEAPRGNDETLKIISEKKHNIREINVNAEQITEVGLLSLSKTARQSLEVLRIMEAKLTSNANLVEFLSDCPNLTHLFINMRGNGPSDELVQVVSKNCTKLEHTILGGKGVAEEPVTAETMKQFIRNAKFLKLLVMDICPIGLDEVEKLKQECRKEGRLAPKLILSLMTGAKIPRSTNSNKCVLC